MTKQLTLAYKGQRTYLHGSDFFNVLTAEACNLTDEVSFISKLTFRRFSIHQCLITDEQPSDTNAVVGQVNFKSLQTQLVKSFWLVETQEAVTSRYDFDEDHLVSSAVVSIEKKEALLLKRTSFTPIEEVIALTKKLNYAVSPDVPGKWVFGQLDLTQVLPADFRSLKIVMKSLLKDRFSVNEIYIDDVMIGKMNFIVGAPAA